MKKNKKILSKFFLWSSLVGLCAGGAVAIGFGVTNFVKYGSKNKGTGYSDSLQTKLQVGIDTNNSNLENDLNLIESIGNKVSLVATNINANEIQVQSGINPDSSLIPNNPNLVIGNIFLNTEVNLYKFNFNFNVDGDEKTTDSEKANLQAKLDLEKLNLYLTLIQNNSYQLINNVNLPNSSSKLENVNFSNIYNLNTSGGTKDSSAFLQNEKMMFSLKERTDNVEKNWDLSDFQKQFTSVYNWDGDLSETTYRQVINNFESDESNSSKKKEAPNDSYILWKNRNGLINLLQILTTISYLNETLNISNDEIDQSIKTRVNSLYSSLSANGDYDSFMKWCGKRNDVPISQIMSSLYLAQSIDFGLTSNNNVDPLLEILNSYYIYKSSTDGKIPYESYEFLYSWNLNGDTLISPYLASIDYYNWFDFFPSLATEEQKKDKEYLKNNYFSNALDVNWTVSKFGASDVRTAVNFANNAYIDKQFMNYYLLKSSVNGDYVYKNINRAKLVYKQMFNGFIENTVSLIPSKYNNSIIGVDSFSSGIIAFGILILIIAIVVSILYRIPGVFLGLSLFVSQGITLLVLSSLSITITINTLFAFISALFLPLIPFVYGFLKLKDAINSKKLNINNSFKVFLSSYVWMSILTYSIPLIVSLVALLFGQYQIKSFGAILIIANFNSFIICFAFFLILVMISYYLFIKTKPKLILNSKDIKSLSSIHNVTSFDINIPEENNIQSKWISKINDQIANGLLTKKWWTYLILGILVGLSIIGIILLVTLNNNVINFKYTKQLVLTYSIDNQDQVANVETFINKLANSMNVKWDYIYTYQLDNGMWQKVLISNSNLNINQVFDSVNAIDPTWKNSLSFRVNNAYFASLLFNNGINCLLISLAFIAILNLFMFNIINVVPMFVMQLIINIVMIGIIGLFQIPINLNVIESYIVLFIISNALISMILFNVKKPFNLKKRHTTNEIYDFAVKQIKELLIVVLILLIGFLLINIYMFIFDSAINLFSYLINGLINIYGVTVAIILIPFWFTWTMYLREKYLAHTLNNNLVNQKHKWYDKVDEQIIAGINHN